MFEYIKDAFDYFVESIESAMEYVGDKITQAKDAVIRRTQYYWEKLMEVTPQAIKNIVFSKTTIFVAVVSIPRLIFKHVYGQMLIVFLGARTLATWVSKKLNQQRKSYVENTPQKEETKEETKAVPSIGAALA